MTLGDMKVRRVPTEHGSIIEPELDPTWSELAQLRWAAAVENLDSSTTIRVSSGISSTNGVSRWEYCVNVGATGFSSSPFSAAWTLIVGIGAGAREAARAARIAERAPIFDRLLGDLEATS
jgi:hypothetical protein